MDVPDVVEEWNVRCAQCGDCMISADIFLPSCPPGERFKFNSYYAMGRMLIGRVLQEGVLTLEDDDALERMYTCTACRACDETGEASRYGTYKSLHDTRHTHAFPMLKEGIHPKIVQERLGHASIQTTLDIYSHVAPGLQEAAAVRFDEIFSRNAKNKAVENVG